MFLSRLIQGALVAAMLASIGPAAAVPVRSGNYYDETASPPAICSASLCTVFFSKLPTDKLLLVTNVACNFTTPYPVTILKLGVNTSPTSGRLQREIALQLPLPVVSSGTNYMQISHPVNFLVGPGRYPFIEAQTGSGGGSWGATCSLSGTLVSP